MIKEKPIIEGHNAHFLKGHASWLYCDQCGKTVAYLCYVTYRYFRFRFTCSCGCEGFVLNRFGDAALDGLPVSELTRNISNKRYCCAKDESPLFSPVPKNLKCYDAAVVCKQCGTLSAFDRNGKSITVSGSDFLAATFCHEMDHLDGILFTDKAKER